MIRTRIRPLAVVLAAAALMLAAVPAQAGKNIKSKVTLEKLTENGASGKVISKKPKCERRRTVILIFEDDYPGATRLGKTKTNRGGKWAIEATLDQNVGLYYAKLKKKELASGKVCKGDESPLRDL